MVNEENIIEILEVSYLNSSSEKLWGCVIDAPKINNKFDDTLKKSLHFLWSEMHEPVILESH